MHPVTRVAVPIFGRDPSNSERYVEKIIDFFRIEKRALEPGQLGAVGNDSPGTISYSVLISAARLLEEIPSAELPQWLRQAASVFVFGFDEFAASKQVLQRLTGLHDVSIRPPKTRQISVTVQRPDLCRTLSGIVAECSPKDNFRVFVGVGACDGFRSVMSSADGEVFFECRSQGTPVYVSGSSVSLDIDRPVDGRFFDVRHCFSSVVPLAIFLRSAFPDAIGSDQDVGASLIVDDPVLKQRYGFLDFGRVLASMNQHGFCTTIAFIPWNWRRTKRRTAELFLKNPDRYSLVVHGCDHTSNEFGSPSIPILNHKVKTARRRADLHLLRTGIRVSPIMVFPQGVFSPEAAYGLKCNSFVAAVNSEVNPFGGATLNTLLRELWEVAITQYSTFPIFTRRYMSHGLENFAFDAFLGKPCLVVAHHEVFKDDGNELATFVDSLNALTGGMKWGSLEEVVTRSYLSREDMAGTRNVRMFANEMVLEGRREAEAVIVEKKEHDRSMIRRVSIDNEEVDWTWQDGSLWFRVEVACHGTARIKVEYVDPLGESSSTDGMKYRIGVGVRRCLSEVRDDYICRSELLADCAGRVRRWLK